MAEAKRQPIAGKCLFCGGGRLTKEHVWSDWIAKILPSGDRTEGPVVGYDIDGNRFELPQIAKQGAIHTKKVRQVCRSCNNGWMGKIVEDAKPVAEKLLLGIPVVLNTDEQEKLATWLGLAAMMANRLTKSLYKIERPDLDYLHRHKRLPPHWFVAIGTYNGPELEAFNEGAAPSVYRGISPQGEMQRVVNHAIIVAASVLLHLYSIVQVFTPSNHPLAPRFPTARLYAPFLVQIFPSRFPALQFPSTSRPLVSGVLHFGGGLSWDLSQKVILLAEEANKRLV